MAKKIPFLVTNYQVSIWPLCMLAEMLAYHFHKLFGAAYPEEKIGEWKNRVNRWAVDPAGYDKVARVALKKIEQNPQWAWKMTKKIPQVCRDFLKFTRGVFDADLKKKTDKELYDLYMEYRRRFIGMYRYCWFPNAPEGMSNLFTKKLEQYLGKKIGASASVGEYLSVLTTPLRNSVRQKEEKEFILLIMKALKHKSIKRLFKNDVATIERNLAVVDFVVYRTIADHTRKYCWIPFDYDGPAWDERYFIDRARSMIKQRIDPKKKLAELARERKILAKQQQEYARAAGLYKDSHYAYLFKLARELMYLKDYRKDVLFESYYHMDKLIREIGLRLGLTAVQVKHILPSEMQDALVRRQYDPNALNERIKYSVLVYSTKGMRLYTGKQAHKIVRKRVKIERRARNVKELHGQCAYTGCVYGVVRIVCAPSDMIKMKKGDILVSVATNPNLLPAMQKAAAIVTDKGGITSHAAIISRELKIPCVTGTGIASHVLTDGDRVEVDAAKGCVRIL